MRSAQDFIASYRELEERMKALAKADGDVFLPAPAPDGPADYVLIGMEPSLGWWARSADEARSKVDAGFRNFLFSIEDFILHFSVQHYLCTAGERYHITDLSKGAMLVDRAVVARVERYDRWYGLLQEEINLVATPTAGIVAVGSVVAQYLKRRRFDKQFTRILHYSSQAGPARRAGLIGHEESFKAFAGSVSLDNLVATARNVLTSARVPALMRAETISRLKMSQLTTSRQELIFNYKLAFGVVRAVKQNTEPLG
jgi:hypothetical protein